MNESGSKKLVKGALILAGAGLIGKVLGASYRIPLQNLLGDEGFYIYQQVYPLLGLALMLALYGFPSAVAKVISDFNDEGNSAGLRNFLIPAWAVLAIACFTMAGVLYGGAGLLASIIGDQALMPLYRLTAFVFLAIPFTALLRGMWQSSAEMIPVAQSQLAEQFLRVAVIIAAAAVIGTSGGDLYKIGDAAAWAALFGAGGAILILVFHLRRSEQLSFLTEGTGRFKWKRHGGALLGIGLVATLNHALLLLIQFGDMLTLLPGLKQNGLVFAAAIKEKGIFDRGQPLIQIGSVLGSSLALSVMPSISKEKLRDQPYLYGSFMKVAFKLSLAIGVGATVGLIVIFPEVNRLLFEDDSGTGSLRFLMLSVFFSSAAMTMAAMLQGLGLFKRTAIYILVALGMKFVLNLLLVPFYGISGGAAATVLALVVMFMLVSRDLAVHARVLFSGLARDLFVLVAASAGMVLFLVTGKLLFHVNSRTGLLLEVGLLVSIGAVIFLALLVRNRTFFSDEELDMLPASKIFHYIRGTKKA